MTQEPIINAWQAMQVRRWHSNAELSHTVDETGAHSSRVLVLALRLNPRLSRDAVIYAVTHDIGEKKAGDFPYDFKKDNPELAKQIAAYEAVAAEAFGFPVPKLNEDEAKLIKLCDWLDAFLWAKKHRPDLTCRADWQAQLSDCLQIARELGVYSQTFDIVGCQ